MFVAFVIYVNFFSIHHFFRDNFGHHFKITVIDFNYKRSI